MKGHLKLVDYTSLQHDLSYVVVHQEYERSGGGSPTLVVCHGKKEVENYIIKEFGYVLEGSEEEVNMENIFECYLDANGDDSIDIYEL